MRKRWLVALAAAVTSTATAFAAPPSASADGGLTFTPVAGWWGTNGRVTDMVQAGDRIFLAGGFDYIGPQTGYGVGVSSADGRKLAVTPVIDGDVFAAAPDGSGGWYVAGAFTKVGGVSRRGAAQITAAGTVTSWNPKPKGVVRAIATAANEVVLGGSISQLGNVSVSVSNIGAVDTAGGRIVPGWSSSVNGTVRTLVASSRGVFVGGEFSQVNGQARSGLARISTSSGATDSGFTGWTNGPVDAAVLSSDGSKLIVGGGFSGATGNGVPASRARLVAFDSGTGALLPWAPSADGPVLALASDPLSGDVYAGGQFSSVAGVARSRLAGINVSGAVTTFDASLKGCQAPQGTKDGHDFAPCTPEVDALTVAGGSLYVGGTFGQSAGAARHNAAAFTLGSSAPGAWDPVASGPVLALAPSGGNVFVGGDLTSVNGLLRRGLAALSATTGTGDPTFQLDTDRLPLDLELSPDGTRLYVAGNFSTVGGVPRDKVASIDTSTGKVDPSFIANANDTALAVEYASGAVYVAGQFTQVNKVARVHVAKLDAATGAVVAGFVADTSGPPGPLQQSGMVEGLAVRKDGSRVYLGGPFRTVNGVSTPQGIAVVDGRSGALVANQLGGVRACASIGPWITDLYLSPDENRLYGGDVCPDAIYQWDAVNLSSPSRPTGQIWQAWCDGGMQAALEVNGRFYYGTHGARCWTSPSNHTLLSRPRFAVFDQLTGATTSATTLFNSAMGVWSMTAVPQGLLVGGDFTIVGARQTVRQGLALFPGTP